MDKSTKENLRLAFKQVLGSQLVLVGCLAMVAFLSAQDFAFKVMVFVTGVSYAVATTFEYIYRFKKYIRWEKDNGESKEHNGESRVDT